MEMHQLIGSGHTPPHAGQRPAHPANHRTLRRIAPFVHRQETIAAPEGEISENPCAKHPFLGIVVHHKLVRMWPQS
jgi:hypothetical protein